MLLAHALGGHMTTIARISLATLLVLLTHPAFGAPVPFTGTLSIDFTSSGGTALTIPGGGSVTINGGSTTVSPITSLTIPAGVFTGAGTASGGPGGAHVVAGTSISNLLMAFAAGGTCTAGHAQVSCPGGGLAGTGGIAGLSWTWTIIGSGFPVAGSNIGIGSFSNNAYNFLVGAGWSTGTVTAKDFGATSPVSAFTGSQTSSTISLVSPISLTQGRAVARINLSLTLSCGDGLVSAGEQCDDGGTTPGDGCDASCQVEAGVCGDGLINLGEQCDDGGTNPGDGCDASCQIELGWGCVGEPSVCTVECPAAPDPLCLTGFSKGVLLVKENKPGKEKVLAKLIKGPALVQSDFGDPVTGTTGMAACIYDSTGTLAGELIVDRAGDTCAGKACWKAIGAKGYLYKDKDTTADGVKIFKLKGGDSGKSIGLVKAANNSAKGQNSMPTGIASALSSSTNATVQLRGGGAPQCLSVTVDNIKKQESNFFKALSS